MTQLRSVTCHMGSHSVTCYFYPTQVNTHRLHPSQIGWYSIYRPFKGGGLSKLRKGLPKVGPTYMYLCVFYVFYVLPFGVINDDDDDD